MTVPRHAAKRDLNEPAIVQALEKVGCQVLRLDAVDLLILRSDGALTLLEIKTPASRRRLTATQRRLLAGRWPIHIVTTIPEALDAVMRTAPSMPATTTTYLNGSL